MDVPVSRQVERNKRARDDYVDFSEEFFSQKPAILKKLCVGLEIEDTNISSILEGDDENELDETQDRLVVGVMKSLEKELVFSSSSDVPPMDKKSASVVDAENCLIAADAYSFYVDGKEIALLTNPGPETSSYEEKNEIMNFAESTDLSEKVFTNVDSKFSHESTCNCNEGQLSCASHEKKYLHDQSCYTDICYLLEASDDELGILPSSDSARPGSESELYSSNFHENGRSSLDLLDFDSWQNESDCSFGAHFEWELESNEWLKSVLLSLNPSICRHSSSDQAAITAACVMNG